MKVVVIIGPSAVGKMTVGQEVSKLTGLRLCHNHMTIEPILDIIGKYDLTLIDEFRELVFEYFLQNEARGFIFTCMVDFDNWLSMLWLDRLHKKFANEGHSIYYVELYADFETRRARNITPNRLNNKPSKRNIDESEKRLVKDEGARYNSEPGEFPYENYIVVDNTTITASDVALRVIEHFNLSVQEI